MFTNYFTMGKLFTLSRSSVSLLQTKIISGVFSTEIPRTVVCLAIPLHKHLHLGRRSYIASSDLEEFDNSYSDVRKSLVEPNAELHEAISWFERVLDYNVPHGKKVRGVTVVKTYKSLLGSQVPKAEDVQLAHVLGWCTELLQSFFIMIDDIMDGAETRRGKLCWYKKEGSGLIAVNDAILLEAGLYLLIKKYFKDKPYYVNLMELFHETLRQTALGQCLDMRLCMSDDVLDLKKFSPQQYAAVVKFKTSFYSCYLPVALAMNMAGITDAGSYNEAREILLEIGHLFQVQDDFLDCFGDPAVTGKEGTDIQDRKCSWLIVTALSKATKDQMDILRVCYGKHDTNSVTKVKSLYKELDLPVLYNEYEENCYQTASKKISMMKSKVPITIFSDMLNTIYKRKI